MLLYKYVTIFSIFGVEFPYSIFGKLKSQIHRLLTIMSWIKKKNSVDRLYENWFNYHHLIEFIK